MSIYGINGEIEIENKYGNIFAGNIAGSSVINTSYGNIRVIFNELNHEKPSMFSSFGGDIEVVFPDDAQADLKIRSPRGGILSRINLETNERKTQVQSGQDMKRIILVLISVIFLSPLFGQKDILKGFWWIEIKHSEPHLYLNSERDRSGWNYGSSFDLDMLDGYMTGDNVTFYLRSEAGVIEFKGNITGQSGNGTYEWTPNKSYISEMEKIGYDDFSDKEYLIFALKNFRIKTLKEIISLGYDNIPSDKVVAIIVPGITPDYIRDIHNSTPDLFLLPEPGIFFAYYQ